ncbi:hypothetical protein LJC42_03300 [Eubacteriales bacterium OttesenSCG-928-K08]|nr:hypothetical protein [Eubacteriales bacterium OttesenSCG-928-K08]
MKKCDVSGIGGLCEAHRIALHLSISEPLCDVALVMAGKRLSDYLKFVANEMHCDFALRLLRVPEFSDCDTISYLRLCLTVLQAEVALGLPNQPRVNEIIQWYEWASKKVKKAASGDAIDLLNIEFQGVKAQVHHLRRDYGKVKALYAKHDTNDSSLQELRKYVKAQYSASLYLENEKGGRVLSRTIAEELYEEIAQNKASNVDAFFISGKLLEHYEKIGKSDEGLERIMPVMSPVPNDFVNLPIPTLRDAINMAIFYRDAGYSLWLSGEKEKANESFEKAFQLCKFHGLRDQEEKLRNMKNVIDQQKRVGGVYHDSHLPAACDYLIVTIIPEELDAAVYHIANNNTSADKTTQWRKASIDLSSGRQATIVFIATGEPGNLPTHDYLFNALALQKPAKIILVGIAGSVPSRDIGLGDVVLCKDVFDFSVGAINADGKKEYNLFSPKGIDENIFQSGTMISQWQKELVGWPKIKNYQDKKKLVKPWKDLEAASFGGDTTWREKLEENYYYHKSKTDQSPHALFAAIATSNDVVKHPETVKKWLEPVRQIKAIEMEASGVLSAAGKFKCPVVIVRGISDIVGQKRDDDWKIYAANSAAAFAGALIKNGII